MPTTHTAPQPTTTRLQSYQTMLLGRIPHPETFELRDSSTLERGAYALSAWVGRGTHALAFRTAQASACEIVTDDAAVIGETSVLDAFLCAGERDAEHTIPNSRITHMTAAQTEQLPEHLYEDTYNEIDELARLERCVSTRWTEPGGSCLSVVVVQDYAREVHAQAYHLIAPEGLVLRTQTIFELG